MTGGHCSYKLQAAMAARWSKARAASKRRKAEQQVPATGRGVAASKEARKRPGGGPEKLARPWKPWPQPVAARLQPAAAISGREWLPATA